MKIREYVGLKRYNTFGIAAVARRYGEIASAEDLLTVIRSGLASPEDCFILGGGSNVLLPDRFDGLVLRNCLRGIELACEDEASVTLRVASGEVWHDFVDYAVARGLAGIESLALIPGTVGGAAVQNIGAYGAEAADCIVSVEFIDLDNGDAVTLANAECRFAYRQSIFKERTHRHACITAVSFRLARSTLAKAPHPDVRRALPPDAQEYSIAGVRDAVVAIRSAKLPSPAVLGNGGSVFKNPVISSGAYARLAAAHPHMPAYPMGAAGYKIPAGWLIEQAGWKGWTAPNGRFGVYRDHALIIVNHGDARSAEILGLMRDIQRSVSALFDVDLEPELVLPGRGPAAPAAHDAQGRLA